MKIRHVLVFRTSVDGTEAINRLSPLLDKLIGDYGKWDFDLEDCDKILRIESTDLEAHQVEAVLQLNGYFIKELED